MRPAIKVGLSFLSPVFIIIIAKMHKKRPNIFSGAGISLKRKAERIVGIKIPSRLKVVVSGAPFLRILSWISTRALTKPIPLMIPRRTVIRSPEKIADLSSRKRMLIKAPAKASGFILRKLSEQLHQPTHRNRI